MLSTLTTALIIALTLHHNSSDNLQCNQFNIMPQHKRIGHAQTYNGINSDQYQLNNKQICEKLRDSIYENSHDLEQPKDRLPNDFMLISQKTAKENIKKSLTKFEKHSCYQNNYIHYSDRYLFKKLDQDLQK
jgi:hypothetical protein